MRLFFMWSSNLLKVSPLTFTCSFAAVCDLILHGFAWSLSVFFIFHRLCMISLCVFIFQRLCLISLCESTSAMCLFTNRVFSLSFFLHRMFFFTSCLSFFFHGVSSLLAACIFPLLVAHIFFLVWLPTLIWVFSLLSAATCTRLH